MEDAARGATERADIGGENLGGRRRELRRETLHRRLEAGLEGAVVRRLHLKALRWGTAASSLSYRNGSNRLAQA